jgi:hypothetical protein
MMKRPGRALLKAHVSPKGYNSAEKSRGGILFSGKLCTFAD